MKYPDLVDRYAELKYPDRFRQIQAELGNILQSKIGGRSVEQLERDRTTLWVRYYDQFISEGAPFSAEDIVKGRDAIRRPSLNRGKMKKSTEAQELALLAFLEVDQRGGTTAEAIERAWDAVTQNIPNPPRDQKTIPEWLNAILFLTDIKQSPRGRPKKNPVS